MRVVFFLLIFANLVFFAWAQGYFGSGQEGREPQRLAQQLHPEKLKIVQIDPAAAVKKPAIACQGVGGLALADAEALKAAMEKVGWEVKLLSKAEPDLHLVLIADLANKTLAEKKAAELKLLSIASANLVELAGGRYEIILGKFPAAAAAQEFLQSLTKKNVKSAKLETRKQPPLKADLEARADAAMISHSLPELLAPYADAVTGACTN